MAAHEDPGPLATYSRHAALNAGQALRDLGSFFSHPVAEKIVPEGGTRRALSSAALSLPNVAGSLYYGAVPPQLTHTKEELRDLHGASAGKWFLNGMNPEKHPVAMDEKIKTAALYDELAKLGAISDDHARRTLDQLDALERSKPTLSQMGRYALVGAAAGPAIKAVGNVIRGKPLLGSARDVLGEAATGALSAGAVPLLRSHLDRQAARGTLKSYLGEGSAEKTSGVWETLNTALPNTPKLVAGTPMGEALARGAHKVRGLLTGASEAAKPAATRTLEEIYAARRAGYKPKVAFQTSQYSGPLSYGPFKQTSGMPPFRVPSLATPIEKKAGGATTPAGMLATARAVGLPKITSPGGSIAGIAKPKGFGAALPGATNPNSLL